MAIKKRKLTPLQQAYKKEINRLNRAVKRAEKQGYIFDESKLPKMPKRVTTRGLHKLQNTKPVDLKMKARKVDFETGEIISGRKALKEAKAERIRKANLTRKFNKINKEIENNRKPLDYDYDFQLQDLPSYPTTDNTFDEYELYKDEIPVTIEPETITTEDGYIIDKLTGEILSSPEVKPEPNPNPIHDREKYNQKHGLDKYKKEQPIEEYPQFSTIVISNFKNDVSHYPAIAEPLINSWLNELISNYGEADVATMLEDAKANGTWIDYTIAYNRDKLLGMVAEMMEYLPDASDWFKQELSERLEYAEDWEYPD
jgi:hypothetical protein